MFQKIQRCLESAAPIRPVFAGFARHLAVAVMLFGLLALAFNAPAQSARPGWGATPYHDVGGTGVTFRVWAPNATSVTVPGEFNGWSTTAHVLTQEGVTGVWSRDVAGALPGQQYKFFLNGNLWKRDPRGRKVQHTAGNSIIYDPTTFNWSGDSFTPPALSNLVIYELHAGTFPGSTTPSRLIAATNKLDYIKGLGFNAVELMPVAEFPGDSSWGYNPADPFAVENIGYGGPEGLKVFVKACHERGLAVLLDVVHNHYGPDEMDLWEFDGWTGGGNGGGIYFYQDNGICCTVFGSRPNYSRQPVRDYIKDNFKMWLDEYHVDGFRWDTPGLMINATGYGTVYEAISLIQTINWMIKTNYPGKINLSEDAADIAGLNFDSTWDTSFPYTLSGQLTPVADSSRNMNSVTYAVTTNTKYNTAAGLNRVIFNESHDVVGDLNNGARLVTAIDTNTPSSWRARKLSTLGAAITFTAPGVPMIFQGQEMLENLQFSSSRSVDWPKTNTYSRIVRLYRDLARLRRDLDGVTPGLKGDQVSVLQSDNNNKLIAYRRWAGAAPTQDTVVIANFANTSWNNYVLPFPRAGNWYVHFNSDSTSYSADFGNYGTNVMIAAGAPAYGTITIGPYSTVILSQTPDVPPTLAIKQTNDVFNVSWPAAYGGWVLDSSSTLAGNPSWGQISAAQYQTNATSIFIATNPPLNSIFYRLRKP